MLSPRQHGWSGRLRRLFLPTLAVGHPLPHHLLATNRIMTQADSAADLQETDSGAGARAAMDSMQATRIVPHLNKGRLIAFSLLGATRYLWLEKML